MPSTRRSRGVVERDELEQPRALGRAAVRAAEPLVQLEHLVAPCTSRGSGRARRGSRARRGRRGSRRARRRPRRAPRVGAHEPDRDLHERRLPGAVRPEQPDELALLHLEIDALQRLDGPVALPEPVDGEGGRHATRVRHYAPAMPRGYMEGPAAEEAERRAEEAARDEGRAAGAGRVPGGLRLHGGRSRAALPRLAGPRSTPTSSSHGRRLGRHRSAASPSPTSYFDRRDELVDRERGQRLDPRRAAGAEGDRDLRDRRRVGRLDDVDEVELAERRPLVQHLRAELLDVAVHLPQPVRVRLQRLRRPAGRGAREGCRSAWREPTRPRRARPGPRRAAPRRGRGAARGRRRRG